VDLYLDSKSFFSAKGVKQCGLFFIDFFNIQPPDDKRNVWISYLGDSVLKELFIAASQRFSGYEPDDMSEVGISVAAPHLGIPDISLISKSGSVDVDAVKMSLTGKRDRYESHPQYLLCCKANFRPSAKNHEDDGDCILAAKRTPMQSADIVKRHWLYTFDNIQTYIEEFVSPLFVENYKCLSFITATDWPEAEYFVDSFKNSAIHPDAVITNVGLHGYENAISEIQPEVESFFKNIDQGTKPISYIVHSASAVRENECDLRLCKNAALVAYNHMVKEIADSSERVKAYLDLHNYTASLTDLSGSPKTCSKANLSTKKDCTCKRFDGVHFQRVCNYGPIMTQWDFNWLSYLGIFDLN
jgi:hypothetical protein